MNRKTLQIWLARAAAIYCLATLVAVAGCSDQSGLVRARATTYNQALLRGDTTTMRTFVDPEWIRERGELVATLQLQVTSNVATFLKQTTGQQTSVLVADVMFSEDTRRADVKMLYLTAVDSGNPREFSTSQAWVRRESGWFVRP